MNAQFQTQIRTEKKTDDQVKEKEGVGVKIQSIQMGKRRMIGKNKKSLPRSKLSC